MQNYHSLIYKWLRQDCISTFTKSIFMAHEQLILIKEVSQPDITGVFEVKPSILRLLRNTIIKVSSLVLLKITNLYLFPLVPYLAVAEPGPSRVGTRRAKMRKKIHRASSLGKINRNLMKKWEKWNSCPPGTVRLATALLLRTKFDIMGLQTVLIHT